MSKVALLPYITLIRRAVGGEISLEDFAFRFMELFKVEASKFEDTIFEELNNVCLDSDEYVPANSELYAKLKDAHPESVIDDGEFLDRLGKTLEKLER